MIFFTVYHVASKQKKPVIKQAFFVIKIADLTGLQS